MLGATYASSGRSGADGSGRGLHYDAEHVAQMIEWRHLLSAVAGRWSARWQASDGDLKAELFLKRRGSETVVHDTRSGSLVEHELEEMGLSILDFFDGRGWRSGAIARHVKATEEAVAEEIARLGQLGLLFEEDGRSMSLVVLGKSDAVGPWAARSWSLAALWTTAAPRDYHRGC